MPLDIRTSLRQNLTDFQNSVTVGLSSKSAMEHLSYFPIHFKRVATLLCEIQKINLQISDAFNTITPVSFQR